MFEKRKHTRVNKSLSITYQVIYSLGFGSSLKKGSGVTESIDLSEGGISIILIGNQIPQGSLIEIEIDTPGEELPIYLKGEVTRLESISKDKYKIGVKFDYKTSKDSAMLYNLLNRVNILLYLISYISIVNFL